MTVELVLYLVAALLLVLAALLLVLAALGVGARIGLGWLGLALAVFTFGVLPAF